MARLLASDAKSDARFMLAEKNNLVSKRQGFQISRTEHVTHLQLVLL